MLLKELCDVPGVSGDEGKIRALIREKLADLADEVRIDRLGNVIAVKQATGASAPRVLLCAHMDEVGFLIKGITDTGLLQYDSVGFIDPRVAVSKRVRVGEKSLPGVIGAKAIHLQSKAEFGKVLTHKDLTIDIGATTKAQAEELAEIGDYAHFETEMFEFGEGRVCGKAIDDRVGCYILLELLKNRYPVELHCAFTVGEELGMIGAHALPFSIKPDLAIALEGTTANDVCGVPEHEKVVRQKQGPALSFMDRTSIMHRGLLKNLQDIGRRHDIPVQTKNIVAGGTDIGALQRRAGAIPSITISVPCRYIHAPASVCALQDVDDTIRLMHVFLSTGAKYTR